MFRHAMPSARIGDMVNYGPGSRGVARGRKPGGGPRGKLGKIKTYAPPPKEWYLPWYLAEEAADNAGIPKLPEIRKRRRRRRQKKKSGVKSGPVQRMMAVLFEHVSTQPQPLYIFRKMDQDKSGELDRSEFAKAIMSMGTGEKLSDAHMEELMNLMDADQNGTVSLKEFLDRLKMHHMESIRAKLQAAYTGGGVDYEKLFQDVDTDNSGVVSIEELRRAIRVHAKFSENDVTDLFDFMDTNHNKELELREWVTFMQGPPGELADSEHSPTSAALTKIYEWSVGRGWRQKEWFHHADKDGSGSISVDEMRAMLSQYDVGLGESDTELVLVALDTDGDGMISLEEFLVAMRDAKKHAPPRKDVGFWRDDDAETVMPESEKPKRDWKQWKDKRAAVPKLSQVKLKRGEKKYGRRPPGAFRAGYMQNANAGKNFLDVGERRLAASGAPVNPKSGGPPWRPLDVMEWPTPMCLSVVVAVGKLGTDLWEQVAHAVGFDRTDQDCEACWDLVMAAKCRTDLRRAVKYRDRKMLVESVALAKAMKVDSDSVAAASDDQSAEMALAEQVLNQLEEVGLSKFQHENRSDGVLPWAVQQLIWKLRSALYTQTIGHDEHHMFARYDRDRSGSITFDEFCVAVADIKLSRTRFKRDELQIIFNLIDTDSSGEIEIEELIGFIKPPVKGSAAKIAEEEKEEAAAAAQPLSADKPPEGHTYSPFADGHVPGSLITLLASSFDEKEAAKYRKLLTSNGFDEVADIAMASVVYLHQIGIPKSDSKTIFNNARYAQWAKLHGPTKQKSVAEWARNARGEEPTEVEPKHNQRTVLRARPDLIKELTLQLRQQINVEATEGSESEQALIARAIGQVSEFASDLAEHNRKLEKIKLDELKPRFQPVLLLGWLHYDADCPAFIAAFDAWHRHIQWSTKCKMMLMRHGVVRSWRMVGMAFLRWQGLKNQRKDPTVRVAHESDEPAARPAGGGKEEDEEDEARAAEAVEPQGAAGLVAALTPSAPVAKRKEGGSAPNPGRTVV